MRAANGVLTIGLLAIGLVACGEDNKQQTTGAVTFWQDVAPIYNSKCVRCHQQGGIAPFRLDTYADAWTEGGYIANQCLPEQADPLPNNQPYAPGVILRAHGRDEVTHTYDPLPRADGAADRADAVVDPRPAGLPQHD